MINPFHLAMLATTSFSLCACSTSREPIVGTWKMDHVRLICYADGTGYQRFERDLYYRLNKTAEGIETKIEWEKQKANVYRIDYISPTFTSSETGKLIGGELQFNQGCYTNRFKKQ